MNTLKNRKIKPRFVWPKKESCGGERKKLGPKSRWGPSWEGSQGSNVGKAFNKRLGLLLALQN